MSDSRRYLYVAPNLADIAVISSDALDDDDRASQGALVIGELTTLARSAGRRSPSTARSPASSSAWSADGPEPRTCDLRARCSSADCASGSIGPAKKRVEVYRSGAHPQLLASVVA